MLYAVKYLNLKALDGSEMAFKLQIDIELKHKLQLLLVLNVTRIET